MEPLQHEVDLGLHVPHSRLELLGEAFQHHEPLAMGGGDRGETGPGEEPAQHLGLVLRPPFTEESGIGGRNLGQGRRQLAQQGQVEAEVVLEQAGRTQPAKGDPHRSFRDAMGGCDRRRVDHAFRSPAEQVETEWVESETQELARIHARIIPTATVTPPGNLTPMRALLVRHGVTAETGKVLTGRRPGVPLSDRGKLEVRAVAGRLAEMSVAAVYSSPIRRCRETARILSEPHELTPLTDRRLVEADYGNWSGRQLKDLGKLKAWQHLMAAPARFRFPDGETLTEVQDRAVAALEELADTHGDEQVVLVSHADVIRTLLCHYLGTPLDLIHRLHVAPTSLSVIDLSQTGSVQVPVVNRSFDGIASR